MALAWRLHRGSLYAWAAGYLAFGLLVGGAAQAGADLVNGNQQLADMVARLRGQSGRADAWLASVLSLGRLVAARVRDLGRAPDGCRGDKRAAGTGPGARSRPIG